MFWIWEDSHAWHLHGTTAPLRPCGIPVASAWCPCAIPVVSTWCPHGISMASPWCLRAVPVTSLWCPHGVPRHLLQACGYYLPAPGEEPPMTLLTWPPGGYSDERLNIRGKKLIWIRNEAQCPGG